MPERWDRRRGPTTPNADTLLYSCGVAMRHDDNEVLPNRQSGWRTFGGHTIVAAGTIEPEGR